ncbi:uncharacterized protein LOC142578035 isoform X2 [Dermacentor variabilis]|uniref:uncharacterized protein LOC142578035 isoform X2 n=1 Tax=Dermacentor variabilis TaxID=34621 RepID=UPI003F5B0EB6
MVKIVGNASTKIHLDKLWDDHRIYHYGLVDPSPFYKYILASIAVKLAAKGLQMLSSLMYNKRDAKLRPSYTILHHWLYTDNNGIFVGKSLQEVPVDIYVLVVHNEDPNIEFAECIMVPPTLLTGDLLEHLRKSYFYGLRMGISIGVLAKRYNTWPHTLTYAVSTGMSGRWYTPCEQGNISSNGPTGYTLGNKCGLACNKEKITGDNQVTNIAKLCISKKNATNVKYTLAAVGIEMEDADGVCGYGPFPRLRMLKKLAVFFAFNYTSADKETECMAVN